MLVESKHVDHWTWNEKRTYSKFEAYFDLKSLCSKEPYELSYKEMCDRWRWSMSAVRTFVNKLIQDGELTKSLTKHRQTLFFDNQKVKGSGRQNFNKANDKEETDWIAVLSRFNKLTGKRFKVIPEKAKKQINARKKQGFTWIDFENAIKNIMADDYHRENNLKYLTLEFVSREDILNKWTAEIQKPTNSIYKNVS
jgi:uncharacterized phage protein (TIGR02220 family)